MIATRDILLGLVLPFAVALTAAVLLRKRPPVAWIVGVGLGAVAGQCGLIGKAVIKPIESTHWLVWLTFAAMVVSLLRRPRWLHWILRIALCGGAAALIMRNRIDDWQALSTGLSLGGLGLAMLIGWTMLAAKGDGEDRLQPAIWFIVIGALALLHALSESLVMGQLTGALVAALAAVGALSWQRGTLPHGHAAAGVIAITVGCLLMIHLPGQSAAAVALAMVPASPIFRQRTPPRAWHMGPLARVAVSLALIAVVITPPAIDTVREMTDQSSSDEIDYDYGY